jgi:NgoBV-like restriction endonuclease
MPQQHLSHKSPKKKNIIYNLRPSVWYSERAKFKPFSSKEKFLSALNETRYQYPQTSATAGHWLQNVLKNYAEHTGLKLSVK